MVKEHYVKPEVRGVVGGGSETGDNIKYLGGKQPNLDGH